MAIEFDDVHLDVDPRIEEIYIHHFRSQKALVKHWLEHSRQGHISGKVVEIVDSPNLFATNVEVPEMLLPGQMRKALRNKIRGITLTEHDSDETNFICYLAGAHWLRELAKFTQLVQWLVEREVPITWSRIHTSAFMIQDASVIQRVRLSWLDRG